MRSVISLAFMAVLMTLAAPLQAQDVTGDWTLTYSMMGRQGGQAREVSMDVSLQQDDNEVTGTALMAMGGGRGGAAGAPQEIAITDGKIEGDKFTFSVARGMGERSMAFVYSGTVVGATMEGTMAMGGGRGGREPIVFTGVKKEG